MSREKRVIVTGGSSGIGRAAAIHLARSGARVAVLDRQRPEPAVSDLIAREGGAAQDFELDLADEEQTTIALDAAAVWLEGLDAVIHSGGIMRGQGLDIRATPTRLWNDVLTVNLTGTFFVARHATRLMARQGRGALILLASVGGVLHGSGSLAYGTSKGGVWGLALSLEPQLRQLGIRLHCVCPDAIDTPLFRASVAEGISNGIDQSRYDVDLDKPEDLAPLFETLVYADDARLPLQIVVGSKTNYQAVAPSTATSARA